MSLAIDSTRKGGNMACMVNAAKVIAVAALLEDRIGFLEMSDQIERCMQQVTFIAHPALEDYVQTDTETRRRALECLPVR